MERPTDSLAQRDSLVLEEQRVSIPKGSRGGLRVGVTRLLLGLAAGLALTQPVEAQGNVISDTIIRHAFSIAGVDHPCTAAIESINFGPLDLFLHQILLQDQTGTQRFISTAIIRGPGVDQTGNRYRFLSQNMSVANSGGQFSAEGNFLAISEQSSIPNFQIHANLATDVNGNLRAQNIISECRG